MPKETQFHPGDILKFNDFALRTGWPYPRQKLWRYRVLQVCKKATDLTDTPLLVLQRCDFPGKSKITMSQSWFEKEETT